MKLTNSECGNIGFVAAGQEYYLIIAARVVYFDAYKASFN